MASRASLYRPGRRRDLDPANRSPKKACLNKRRISEWAGNGRSIEHRFYGLTRGQFSKVMHDVPIGIRKGRIRPNPANHPLTIASGCAACPKPLIVSADLSINITWISLRNQILALVELLSSEMIGKRLQCASSALLTGGSLAHE